ncbi:MAG: type II toxin-antitoxin system HicB family antitoxin [Desulfosalsimonadaceae bacterium]|nr:type II toxin-antitoxin system HicB family antitoxin [Desulfosalsimonadaceae bacterium]
MKLKVIFEPSEEGGYTVYVPSLAGCISEGETKKEALRNIKEATELYLEPVNDDMSGWPGGEILEVAI